MMSITESTVLALRAFKLAVAVLINQEETVDDDPKQYHDYVARIHEIESRLGFITIDVVRKCEIVVQGRKEAIVTIKAELERQGTNWQRTLEGDVRIAFHNLTFERWEADLASVNYVSEPDKHVTVTLRSSAFYPKAPL